ncbi:hypothetical protein BSL78_20572 [Apostichopus japonicus]|uniref:Uncharacterized protein n=1 Tax=Stichopus japonicus TaxID=307972 RepID=A0A2G8K3K5_STIJA|nr:hypothetical protein BSL78_20572 [Apostichopus japonicus]
MELEGEYGSVGVGFDTGLRPQNFTPWSGVHVARFFFTSDGFCWLLYTWVEQFVPSLRAGTVSTQALPQAAPDFDLDEDPIQIPSAILEELMEDSPLQHLYRNNWGAIRTHHRRNNRVDVERYLLNQRPESVWVLDLITNMTVYVNKLRPFALLCLGIRGAKIEYLGQHKLLSVSVCSNVEGYETPHCFISEGDPASLVDEFITYCHEISQAAFANITNVFSFSGAISTLAELITNEETIATNNSDLHENDSNYLRNVLKPTLGGLLNYCRQIPVIGFNSGKYDINVMKGLMYQSLEKLHQNEDESAHDGYPAVSQVIKRNGDYMSISSKWLKFLDIKNYLAPGFSYKQFLEAYKCQEEKGFFPYDWMDGLEKLSTTSLPSHDNFYNKLKGVNISSVEYQYCQQVWQDHNMTSFRDFLEWYNNKDVVPFLEALDKMFHFYKEKKIDMFKQGISVPGLTLRYLFKDIRKDFFCLFPESHKDLYFLFKNNIVGGPSIIFHRYQEKGRSRIRNGKKCEQVLGFDANALYLWAIMQDMPTGVVLRRREETGFRREFTHYLQKTAAGWLEWEGQTRGMI